MGRDSAGGRTEGTTGARRGESPAVPRNEEDLEWIARICAAGADGGPLDGHAPGGALPGDLQADPLPPREERGHPREQGRQGDPREQARRGCVAAGWFGGPTAGVGLWPSPEGLGGGECQGKGPPIHKDGLREWWVRNTVIYGESPAAKLSTVYKRSSRGERL